MNDIETRDDIVSMVNLFYDKIKQDTLLSPFFKNLNFDKHLPKMVDFWAFVLLDEVGYTTNVTEKHLHMKLKKEHFSQWLFLFNLTIDNNWRGEKAELVKQRAYLIAWTIESKMVK